jgi:hypothetical protein
LIFKSWADWFRSPNGRHLKALVSARFFPRSDNRLRRVPFLPPPVEDRMFLLRNQRTSVNLIKSRFDLVEELKEEISESIQSSFSFSILLGFQGMKHTKIPAVRVG